MAELKCPHCGKTFKVDDTSYADILSQVRNKEFEEELHTRLKDAEKQANADKDLALAKQEAAQTKKIAELEAKLKQAETDKELAITKALAPVEKELESAKSDLKTKTSEAKLREESLTAQVKLRESALKTQYEGALKLKDEEIDRLKDLKSKLSTKMVGETLEQHCQTEFNKLRATAFQNAYFQFPIGDCGNTSMTVHSFRDDPVSHLIHRMPDGIYQNIGIKHIHCRFLIRSFSWIQFFSFSRKERLSARFHKIVGK